MPLEASKISAEWQVTKNSFGADSSLLARAGHSTTVVGDKVYVLGGRRGSHFFNDVLVLDTIGTRWQRISANAPFSPRANHSATLVDGFIWLIGGADGQDVYGDVYCLDVKTHKWRAPSLSDDSKLLLRSAHAADVHPADPHSIIIHGGYGGPGQYDWLSDTVVLNTHRCAVEAVQALGDLMMPRGYHSLSTVGSRCYLIGGRNDDGLAKGRHLLAVFDPAACAWALNDMPAADCPAPRTSHRVVKLRDGVLLLHGGTRESKGNGSIRLEEMLLLETRGRGPMVWRNLQLLTEPGSPAPEGVSAHSLVAVGSSLLIIHGYGGVGAQQQYNEDLWRLPLEAVERAVQQQPGAAADETPGVVRALYKSLEPLTAAPKAAGGGTTRATGAGTTTVTGGGTTRAAGGGSGRSKEQGSKQGPAAAGTSAAGKDVDARGGAGVGTGFVGRTSPLSRLGPLLASAAPAPAGGGGASLAGWLPNGAAARVPQAAAAAAAPPEALGKAASGSRARAGAVHGTDVPRRSPNGQAGKPDAAAQQQARKGKGREKGGEVAGGRDGGGEDDAGGGDGTWVSVKRHRPSRQLGKPPPQTTIDLAAESEPVEEDYVESSQDLPVAADPVVARAPSVPAWRPMEAAQPARVDRANGGKAAPSRAMQPPAAGEPRTPDRPSGTSDRSALTGELAAGEAAAKLAQLQAELAQLRGELSLCRGENVAMQGERATLQAENIKRCKEAQEAKDNQQALLKSWNSQADKLRHHKERERLLQHDLDQLMARHQAEGDQLRTAQEQLRQQLRTAQDQVHQSHEQVQQLRTRLEQVQAGAEQQGAVSKQLEAANKQLDTRIKQLEGRCKQLEATNQQLSGQLHQASATAAQLQAEKLEADRAHDADHQHQLQHAASLEAKLALTQQQLDSTRRSEQEQERRLQELLSSNCRFSKALEQLQANEQSLRSELEQKQQNLQTTSDRLQQALVQVNSLELARTEAERAVGAEHSMRKDAEGRLAAAESDAAALRAETERLRQLLSSYEEARQQLHRDFQALAAKAAAPPAVSRNR